MNDLVSVIIPNYNYARYVTEAITSVEKQTHKNKEIIVIDNGSTDDSLQVLKSFGDRIRLIAQENQGQSGARNSGLKAAKGNFIAFLDADDTWAETKLEKQLALFSDPEVGLVYCGFHRIDAKGKILSTTYAEKSGYLLEDFALSPAAAVLGGESTAVLRKSIAEKVGLFDLELSIGTGWDYWRRVASISKIASIREPLMLYRQHGNNLSRRMDIYEHDTLLKLKKLFQEEISKAAHPLKSRSYGAHLIALSGAYFQNAQILKALYWAMKAFFHYPPAIGRALALPLRLLQRIGT